MGEKKVILAFLSILMVMCLVTVTHAVPLTPKVLYQKISPGVVFIYAAHGSQGGSAGTGSIISKDGYVITNAHIFTQEGSQRLVSDIQVFLKPHKITGNPREDLVNGYKGKIVAYNIPLDLVLLKIMGFNVPVDKVNFGDSDIVAIGDQAYAIGHPEQGGLWSLTTGVVSAFKADYAGVPGKDLFQTEASINRGNSGGPLLNEEGLMIGINSLIARKAADGLTITDVNFSIRSNVAIQWLNGLGYRIAAMTHAPAATAPVDTREVKEAPLRKEPPAKAPPAEIEPIQPEKAPISTGPKTGSMTSPIGEPKSQQSGPKPIPKQDQGKILTEKKPYDMDELIEGMKEMEDMMDEMKGRINRYKNRR
jgi:serine protease Do